MKTIDRRTILAAGVSALPTVLAAGRGARALGEPGVTQLSFWGGWTGPDGGVMQELVRDFNSQSRRSQVTLTLYNWDLIFDRWQVAFDGGAPPDLVGLHATEVAEFAARGMLAEISGPARRNHLDGGDFFGPLWQLCQDGGGLFAIPLDIHPLGLYIDATAARRAGLDPLDPPSSASALLDWATRLTDRRRGAWGFATPAGDVECFRQWFSLLYQLGGRFLDSAQRRCLADSDAGVRAFSFLRDLVGAHRVAMPEEGSVDADFLVGKVRMYAQGPWYIKGLLKTGRQFVTAPLPRIGGRDAVWANSHVLGVVNTQDTARIDAAMTFIAWLDSQALRWAEAGQLPARNSARAQLHRTSIWPYLRPFAAQIPAIVYQPNVVIHTQLFAESQLTPPIRATQAVMLGRQTPTQAARALSVQVDQLLAAPGT